MTYQIATNSIAQPMVLVDPATGEPYEAGTGGLPTGAATSAKQDTQITAEQAILAKLIAAPATEAKQNDQITQETAAAAVLGTTAGAAVTTDASGTIQQYLRGLVVLFVNFLTRLPAALGAGGGLKVDGSGTALPVSGTVTATVTGVATEATLAAASAKLPAALGQTTSAGSMSVVPASDYINVNQPHALTANRWQYAAAASGIANTTTAVAFKAADATLRNYVVSVQIMFEALGAATELAIRDGAGGTVIWRTKIPAGMVGELTIVFPVPLKGTAATLMEVLTLTASVSGAVYFNAQGFIAA